MWEISVENVWNPSTCEKIWEIREEQVWVSATIWLSFIRLHWVKQLGHWVLDNPSKIYKSKQIYYKFQPYKLNVILTLYTKHTYQSCRTFRTPVHINLIFAIWTFYGNFETVFALKLIFSLVQVQPTDTEFRTTQICKTYFVWNMKNIFVWNMKTYLCEMWKHICVKYAKHVCVKYEKNIFVWNM